MNRHVSPKSSPFANRLGVLTRSMVAARLVVGRVSGPARRLTIPVTADEPEVNTAIALQRARSDPGQPGPMSTGGEDLPSQVGDEAILELRGGGHSPYCQ